jgi:CRISPR-associated endonuclease/helicase Cas3
VSKKFWAKTDKADNFREKARWHSLVFHMIDVAAVTEGLWQGVLERQFRREIALRLGLGEEEAGKWLAFWAGLHDLGKASPAFQGKWPIGWERLEDGLRKKPPPRNPLPHGILTAIFIPDLLKEKFPTFPTSLADKLGRALGGASWVLSQKCRAPGYC